jgi:hypothetical protein
MKTMTDRLEQNLREAFSYRDAQLDTKAIARLRAHDYRPRRHRVRRLPAFGALGATGAAATAGVIVALGSSAAPAFAGWQATPTAPAAAGVTQAAQACGRGLGSPVLTDARGPYTAAIYAESNNSAVCLSGSGVSMQASSSSSSVSGKSASVAAGGIQFGGGGMRDTAGDALTLADGRVGSAVTGVSIQLSDGTSVQATISNGWYLAWWPGNVSATQAQITTASGTNDVTYPAAPPMSCPSGGQCSIGYGFGGAGGGTQLTSRSQMMVNGGSSSSASSSTASSSAK